MACVREYPPGTKKFVIWWPYIFIFVQMYSVSPSLLPYLHVKIMWCHTRCPLKTTPPPLWSWYLSHKFSFFALKPCDITHDFINLLSLITVSVISNTSFYIKLGGLPVVNFSTMLSCSTQINNWRFGIIAISWYWNGTIRKPDVMEIDNYRTVSALQ